MNLISWPEPRGDGPVIWNARAYSDELEASGAPVIQCWARWMPGQDFARESVTDQYEQVRQGAADEITRAYADCAERDRLAEALARLAAERAEAEAPR